MSVLKSVIDVNNGNTGWTKQNLMDAFETALGNLGMNAGSSVTGVPQICVAPGGESVTLGGSIASFKDANNADYPANRNWGSPQINIYDVIEGLAPTTISMVTNGGNGTDYIISGTDRTSSFAAASDPSIEIYVGDTITFDNSALSGGHPMYIRVSDGGASVSNPAATGEGTATVSYTPTATGTYYYQCSVTGHEGMIGTITVSTPTDTDYRLLRRVGIDSYAPYSDPGQIELATDTIKYYPRHGLNTGDPVRYLPGETDPAYSLGTNLLPNSLVYVIKVDRDSFKLATSAANAANGIAIDLTALSSTSKTFPVVFIQEPQQASDYVNPNIEVYHGDKLQFNNNAANSTNITVCRDVDSFDNDQRIVYNDPTYGYTPPYQTSVSYRVNTTNISCVPGNDLLWDTISYEQSESEPLYPSSALNPSFLGRPGEDGTKKYIYCSETNSSAKGIITLLPSYINVSYPSQVLADGYYKYTVPASGGRSELKLRVWRYGWNDGTIKNVTIHSIGTGWSDDEEFTIPGELVGGNATTGDIRFGVTTPESYNNAYDGIASIKTTTLGGGSNFYQKSGVGAWAILNAENDATKKYGNTFYSFYLQGSASAAWTLKMQSGTGWEFLNRKGTSSTLTTANDEWGAFTGYNGLDRQSTNINASATVQTLSTSSTPTAYPMQIRTFRAQAPQDTSFAVIQFTQIINTKIVPYATFSIHTGSGYGNGTFDLDHVFLSGYTQYKATTQYIDLTTYVPGYVQGTGSYWTPNREPISDYSQARNAYFGYMRGDSTANEHVYDHYYNNIREGTNNATAIYYRNSTYDTNQGISVDAAADYYKPIKTIPVSQRMIPCPYYLPDDFVLLQVATTPGLTEFRPGDTVTVSGSEIYEVIQAAYQTQQTGLDGVSNNSSEGMLFLARTT